VTYGAGAAGALLLLLAFFTCSGAGEVSACPQPDANSPGAATLARARSTAAFPIRYPCFLPASERLTNAVVTGQPGRQQLELVFDGPYEMAIRQSQFPPPASPDPTGSSRLQTDLFPNVPATFIQQVDGSRRALYHLFWEQDGFFFELQAAGPPVQQRQILEISRSLQ
jgi:hypothetical protein